MPFRCIIIRNPIFSGITQLIRSKLLKRKRSRIPFDAIWSNTIFRKRDALLTCLLLSKCLVSSNFYRDWADLYVISLEPAYPRAGGLELFFSMTFELKDPEFLVVE